MTHALTIEMEDMMKRQIHRYEFGVPKTLRVFEHAEVHRSERGMRMKFALAPQLVQVQNERLVGC